MPQTATDPAVGASTPPNILMVVVLPAPLGPMNPKISPRPTLRVRRSTAVNPL